MISVTVSSSVGHMFIVMLAECTDVLTITCSIFLRHTNTFTYKLIKMVQFMQNICFELGYTMTMAESIK